MPVLYQGIIIIISILNHHYHLQVYFQMMHLFNYHHWEDSVDFYLLKIILLVSITIITTIIFVVIIIIFSNTMYWNGRYPCLCRIFKTSRQSGTTIWGCMVNHHYYFLSFLPINIFRALTNITSTDRTHVVVEYGAVPHLSVLLTSANPNIREQSAWCLG